jgi:tetratricopeptide (TPR) repeat protein
VGPGGAAPGRSSAVSVFDGQWKHEFKAFHSLYLSLLLIAGTSHSGTQPEPSYDVLLQQGNEQLQAGRTDQALDSAESATKIRPDRWEGYALEGGALLKMKRYEAAADALSKAIDRAPDSNQHALRETRRQCLLAESGYPAPAKSSDSSSSSSEAKTAQIEEDPQHLADKLTWVEPETDLMWARNSRLAEYAHANFGDGAPRRRTGNQRRYFKPDGILDFHARG